MANISLGDSSILHCAGILHPFARLLGLDGFILMAFILGLPANNVLPILIMSYLSRGNAWADNLIMVRQLLLDNGWTWLTAVCDLCPQSLAVQLLC